MHTNMAARPSCRAPARRFVSALVAIHAAALIAACGGGGGGDGGGGPVQTAAPTIVVQPHDLHLVAGQPATLAVTAAGNGLAYQWQSSTDGGQTWADVASQTSATLALDSVDLDAASTVYRLQVSNAGGSATSRTVQLAMDPSPAAAWITHEPVGATVVVGQSAQFTIGVLNATAIAWQVSTDRAHWATIPGASGQTLNTSALTLADDAKYFRAVASNARGSVYSDPAWLRVNPAAEAPGSPNTASTPSLWRTTPSGDATVAIMSSATPTPVVTWEVSADGAAYTPFQGEASAHDLTDNRAGMSLFGANTFSQITIARASMDQHNLLVRAKLTNSSGTWTTSSLRLSRNSGPFISAQPADQSLLPGQLGAAFEVGAVGTGLSYQWQASRDGGNTFTDIAGATSARWVQPADAAIDHLRVQVTGAGATSTSRAAALIRSSWQTVRPAPTGESLVSLAWRDTETVLAVDTRNSILRSIDGGATWQVVSAPVDEGWSWGAVAVNTRPGGTRTALAVDDYGAIRRSTDGLNWVTLVEPYQFVFSQGAWFKDVAYADANTAVAVGLGVIRSTDDGRTWTSAVISGPAMPTLNAAAFNDQGIGLVGGVDGALLRSLDGGAHWAPIEVAGMGTADIEAIAFASDNLALAAGSQGLLLRSEDAGATWARIDTSFQQWPDSTFNAIAMRDALHGTLASDDGLYGTTDGGKTWSLTKDIGFYLAAASNTLGRTVAAGARGTIAFSPNGGSTWIDVAGDAYGGLRDVAFASTDVAVAVSEIGNMLRSNDRGQTWTRVGTANGLGLEAVAFASTDVGVAVGVNGRALRTVDAGQTWSPLSGLGDASLSSIDFSSTTNGVAISWQGIYRSTDAGVNWTKVSGDSSLHAVRFGSATAGMAVGYHGAQRTADGGQTWTPVTIAADANFESVWYLDATTVLVRGQVSGQHLLYRSTNGGDTWTAIPLDFNLAKAAFASTSLGLGVDRDGFLFRTSDGGLSWTREYWGGAFPTGGIAFADAHTAIAVSSSQREVRRSTGY